MDIMIYPSRLSGSMKAPPSKSAAHRALICAALASMTSEADNGKAGALDSGQACRVWPIQLSHDMQATCSGLLALGCEVEEEFGSDRIRSWLVSGGGHPMEEIHCGESASAFRFFLPILAALGRNIQFTGTGKLPGRPMEPLFSLLEQHGVRCEHPRDKNLPLAISGCLEGGEFSIRGDLSSQYITGLLFALPLLCQDSQIHLTSALESAPYTEMTLRQLEQAHITVRKTEDGFFIPGGQRYEGKAFPVEGDYSNSAFFLCAAAVAGSQGETVVVEGLPLDSCQGDSRITELLSQMGAPVSQIGDLAFGQNMEAGRTTCFSVKRGQLRGMEIDLRDVPDLGPILAVLGAYAQGKTTLFNAGRLRIKESDRLSAISDGLRKMGVDVSEFPDKLVIVGKETLEGGCEVSSANDHRIAMGLSIAALGCKKPVVIRQAECVNKSYPHFFEELNRLGGKTDVVNLG